MLVKDELWCRANKLDFLLRQNRWDQLCFNLTFHFIRQHPNQTPFCRLLETLWLVTKSHATVLGEWFILKWDNCFPFWLASLIKESWNGNSFLPYFSFPQYSPRLLRRKISYIYSHWLKFLRCRIRWSKFVRVDITQEESITGLIPLPRIVPAEWVSFCKTTSWARVCDITTPASTVATLQRCEFLLFLVETFYWSLLLWNEIVVKSLTESDRPIIIALSK